MGLQSVLSIYSDMFNVCMVHQLKDAPIGAASEQDKAAADVFQPLGSVILNQAWTMLQVKQHIAQQFAPVVCEESNMTGRFESRV